MTAKHSSLSFVFVRRFTGGSKKRKAVTNDIAAISEVAPEHISRRGRDSYNNMLSYLIHIKDMEKRNMTQKSYQSRVKIIRDFRRKSGEMAKRTSKEKRLKTAKMAQMNEALILNPVRLKKASF